VGTTNRRRDTRKLFVWLDQIRSDRELPPVAFLVAYEIGQHFNARYGGAAWPSSLTIANNIGVGKATVIRVVRQLRERGHLTVEPGRAGGPPGRGHSNRYRMSKLSKKGSSANPLEPEKGSTRNPKGFIAMDLNYLEPPTGDAKEASPVGERESELALAVPAGALAPVGGAPEEKNKALIEDRFAELLAIWQRPWGEDDEDAAHRAFASACREADPGDIIASARSWVAVADDPRFLKPLTKWLAKDLWRNQPPSPRQKRNGGKVSLSRLALEIGSQWGR
jgi:Helix-turn-helix domain